MNEEQVGNTSDQAANDRRNASADNETRATPGWRDIRKKTSRARVERVKEAVRQAREVLSRYH
jgi:hypothetical protein